MSKECIACGKKQLDKDTVGINKSFGQVLYCPYDYDKVRLIVKKMTD